jgi:alpha-tubulin suppressor-like RCC1 family protein
VDEIDFPPDIVIRKIATGKHHVLALDSNGKVWTGGKNDKCQLGYNSD